MKASELIARLQEQVNKYGDRDVCIANDGEIIELAEGLSTIGYEDLTKSFSDAREEENYIYIKLY